MQWSSNMNTKLVIYKTTNICVFVCVYVCVCHRCMDSLGISFSNLKPCTKWPEAMSHGFEQM